MRILAIDTSCSSASCALLNEDKLEAEIFLNHKLQHSVILFPMIENILQMVEASMEDIDGIAVSGGPGSFTGLRIGVATAKGIVQGGNKKFIAISSLDAMAFQQGRFDGIICPMMDALRDNVYTALYRWKDEIPEKYYDYNAMHIDELIEELEKNNDRIVFCGDVLELHKQRILERLKDRACFSNKMDTMPRASSIGELALKRLQAGVEDDIYTYSPIYLRKPQAEREYERKHGEIVE